MIECLDALECIRLYDRPHTLFFVDPPYFGGEADYAVRFDRYQALADLLANIKGRFILSLVDCKEARSIFKPFRISTVTLKYTIGRSASSRSPSRSELIIQNF